MLKDDTPIKGVTGDLEVIDLDEQLAKRARKVGSRTALPPRPERHVSRPVRIISSLVAVLVVAVLAGGAFLLFSGHEGPESSVTGSNVPLNARAFYIWPGTSGQLKKADIYALSMQNGSVYWKATLKTQLTISKLVPYQGKLFAPGEDGNLYALSAKTGQVLWKYSVKSDPAPDEAPASPIADGNTVYFEAGSGFYALNISDGKLLWHVKTPCKPTIPGVVGTDCVNVLSTVDNGKVYGFFDGLYAFDASNGKQLWHDPQVQFRGENSIVVSGKYLYSAGERLDVLNVADGKKVNAPAFSSLNRSGSLLEADGVVYYSTGTQLTAIRDLDILWQHHYANGLTPLAASQNTLFVDTDHPLEQTGNALGIYFYALDASTGKIKWHWEQRSPNGRLPSLPYYITSMNGKLYLYLPENGFSNNSAGGLWVLHDGKRDFYPSQN
ncbi:hypothetical protein KSB_22450 [Ktedonobacter robiniae]|uniref:Pyrrolo-quinoline quinone repeat domain-containing protein n=2 Tax=Ktedonobacter robiniae TaxID=2778365 RepID=A0ABQ3UN10_9CHLR|nr:hypothetical protein KSB_22450 [Ktedonobacter robiniae]